MIYEADSVVSKLGLDAIAHGCGCDGVMGGSLSESIKILHPYLFDQYQLLCKRQLFNLGDVWFYQSKNPTRPHVLSLATLDGPEASYYYLDLCCEKILENYASWGIASLGMPLVCEGFKGLSETELKDAFCHHFGDSSLEVVLFHDLEIHLNITYKGRQLPL